MNSGARYLLYEEELDGLANHNEEWDTFWASLNKTANHITHLQAQGGLVNFNRQMWWEKKMYVWKNKASSLHGSCFPLKIRPPKVNLNHHLLFASKRIDKVSNSKWTGNDWRSRLGSYLFWRSYLTQVG